MKKTMKNTTHIEGLLYQHKLKLKTTGENSKHPGTEFISGTIDVATDDACLNVVSVHFTYCTAKTSKNKDNDTFKTLSNVLNGTYKTVTEVGPDNATKLRIDSAIGLNEFISDQNGEKEYICAKRNEGGFVHATTDMEFEKDEKARNKFNCDMVITGVKIKEADEEKNLPEKAIVKGYIFDFRKALLPVEFSAINPKAIDYFMGLEASEKEPVFTNLWGNQISQTIVKTIETESAFGDNEVREVKSTRKDFIITGAAAVPYDWDTEETITVQEMTDALAAREVHKAEVRKNYEDYQNSKDSSSDAAPAKKGFAF